MQFANVLCRRLRMGSGLLFKTVLLLKFRYISNEMPSFHKPRNLPENVFGHTEVALNPVNLFVTVTDHRTNLEINYCAMICCK